MLDRSFKNPKQARNKLKHISPKKPGPVAPEFDNCRISPMIAPMLEKIKNASKFQYSKNEYYLVFLL